MEYDYKKIRNQIRKLVKEACFSRNNKFKDTAWDYHILSVVEHCLRLGKKLNADLEVLELAALLHDYSGILDFKLYKEHHINSSNISNNLLLKTNFPKEKIDHISECILNHRGSTKRKHKSIESKILASADAMSHITELADMFSLAFGVHGFKTEPGARWLKRKLNRSWNKIMPQGKKMVKKEYEIAMRVLNSALEKNK